METSDVLFVLCSTLVEESWLKSSSNMQCVKEDFSLKTTFSIITSVFNSEKWLEQCLSSIEVAIDRVKELATVEVICVDDGSTDSSGRILDMYAAGHPWCKVIHQKNAGVSIARNVGLQHASGEWVSFVDDDDLLRADYFLQFINSSKKADISFFCWARIVSSGEFRINGLSSTSYITDHDEIGRFVFKLIFNRTGENLFGYTWNKFIRRDLLEKHHIRFPELKNYIEYEDEIFTFKVCHHAESLAYLPQQLYYYRLGDNNSSRHRTPRHLERSKAEMEIGDQDDRREFKSAAYMQAGMALLMRSYTSFSLRASIDAARFMKDHQQYLVPIPGADNRLAGLSRQSMPILVLRLFLHGCAYTARSFLRKCSVNQLAGL